MREPDSKESEQKLAAELEASPLRKVLTLYSEKFLKLEVERLRRLRTELRREESV